MATVQTAKPIYSATLYVEHCHKCGIAFGMPTEFQHTCKRDKATFFCPNGHGQAYCYSIEEDLRSDLDDARAAIADWRRENASLMGSLIATKGHLTRAKRRAAAGVCQECNRTFQNVAHHYHTKHGPTHDQSVCAVCKGQAS